MTHIAQIHLECERLLHVLEQRSASKHKARKHLRQAFNVYAKKEFEINILTLIFNGGYAVLDIPCSVIN